MSKYVVDTEVINGAVKQLTILEKTCEENRKKKKPSSEDDKGNTHQEVDKMCDNILNTWKELQILLKKTIGFLSENSEKIDTTDKTGANAIKKHD